MKKVGICLLALLALALVISLAAAQEGDTYYIKVRSARVREQPNTTSDIIATLRNGTSFVALSRSKARGFPARPSGIALRSTA